MHSKDNTSKMCHALHMRSIAHHPAGQGTTTAESLHPAPKAGTGAARLESGTADPDLGKRNPARLCQSLPLLHQLTTPRRRRTKPFEMFVTILEDDISLKNKYSLFKWIRRTLQLNECLISKKGVTPTRTQLLSQAALNTVITLDW